MCNPNSRKHSPLFNTLGIKLIKNFVLSLFFLNYSETSNSYHFWDPIVEERRAKQNFSKNYHLFSIYKYSPQITYPHSCVLGQETWKGKKKKKKTVSGNNWRIINNWCHFCKVVSSLQVTFCSSFLFLAKNPN